VLEFFTKEHVDYRLGDNEISFRIKLSNFQGKAFIIKKA